MQMHTYALPCLACRALVGTSPCVNMTRETAYVQNMHGCPHTSYTRHAHDGDIGAHAVRPRCCCCMAHIRSYARHAVSIAPKAGRARQSACSEGRPARLPHAHAGRPRTLGRGQGHLRLGRLRLVPRLVRHDRDDRLVLLRPQLRLGLCVLLVLLADGRGLCQPCSACAASCRCLLVTSSRYDRHTTAARLLRAVPRPCHTPHAARSSLLPAPVLQARGTCSFSPGPTPGHSPPQHAATFFRS
jgi:hypothetical protein